MNEKQDPVPPTQGELSAALKRFEREGGHSEPVVFGSPDKPEAVLVPHDEYQALARTKQRLLIHARSTASIRAEKLRPSPEADLVAAKWIAGEISTEEMYDQTLKLYRKD